MAARAYRWGWRELAISIALSLVVSLLLVFGLAWLPYAFVVKGKTRYFPESNVSPYHGAWVAEVPAGWPGPHMLDTGWYGSDIRVLIQVHHGDGYVSHQLYAERTGWPVPALQAAQAKSLPIVTGGAPLNPSANAVVHFWDRGVGSGLTPLGGLPIRPVLPGFLVSWGTLFAIVFAALTGLRLAWVYGAGRRRRVRGLCQECGYDRAGDTADRCPECGHEA